MVIKSIFSNYLVWYSTDCSGGQKTLILEPKLIKIKIFVFKVPHFINLGENETPTLTP